jgi:hypothetical protein
MIIKAFVCGSKSVMYEAGSRAGLSGEALRMFSNALAEVEFELEVCPDTGIAKIIKVDGMEVIRPVEPIKIPDSLF